MHRLPLSYREAEPSHRRRPNDGEVESRSHRREVRRVTEARHGLVESALRGDPCWVQGLASIRPVAVSEAEVPSSSVVTVIARSRGEAAGVVEGTWRVGHHLSGWEP